VLKLCMLHQFAQRPRSYIFAHIVLAYPSAPKHAMPPKNSSNEIPLPPGFPQGWRATGRIGLSGKSTGVMCVTYHSLDGRHKNCGRAQALRISAAERGEDPETAVSRFEEGWKAFVARFRRAYGPLDKIVHGLPGWKITERSDSGEGKRNCNKYVFQSPDGTQWPKLEDFEADLGRRMAHGEDLSEVIGDAKETPADRAALTRPSSRRGEAHEAPPPSPVTDSIAELAAGVRASSSSVGNEHSFASAGLEKSSRTKWQTRTLQRWSSFTFRKRVASLAGLVTDTGEEADARLAAMLAKRARFGSLAFAAWAPLGISDSTPRSEEECWVRAHPLWRKMTLRGYPLPISDREVFALRAYTPQKSRDALNG